jgi:hypothetical protein
VEVEHHQEAFPGLGAGGNMDEVLATAPVEVDRELLVAWWQLLGAAGGRCGRTEDGGGHDSQNGQDRQPAHGQDGTDGSLCVRRVHVPIP